MARFMEPTAEDLKVWEDWLKGLKPEVRRVAERFSPFELYLLKTSGHRVYITAYHETKDGEVQLRVAVTGDFNLVAFEREVFGIKPEDLTPCEVPEAEEPVGNRDLTIEEAVEEMERKEKALWN